MLLFNSVFSNLLTRGSYTLLSNCLHIVYLHMKMQNCIANTYNVSSVSEIRTTKCHEPEPFHICNIFLLQLRYFQKRLHIWDLEMKQPVKDYSLSLPWLAIQVFAVIWMRKCLWKKTPVIRISFQVSSLS